MNVSGHYKLFAVLLTTLLVIPTVVFIDAFGQQGTKISTRLAIDKVELKDKRDVFKDLKSIFFEGEVIKITGDLRTTVRSTTEDLKIREGGIGGATIKIVTIDNGNAITLTEAVTSSDGKFTAEWKVELLGHNRPMDIFAVYDGNMRFQSAQSQRELIVIRATPLELNGINGNMSVGISHDPVVLRHGHIARIDLEFHRPKSTSILKDVWYDFVIIQGARKIRQETNVFSKDGKFTHLFMVPTNNELSISIYLRGLGERKSFKPLNDLVEFTLQPLANREIGVVINTDKGEYFFQERIFITGRILTIEPVQLMIQVRDPNGNVCLLENLSESKLVDGKFQIEVRVDEKRCDEPGRYRVIAIYGTNRAETAFIIKQPTVTMDIIHRQSFSLLRINNAPFADSVYEVRFTMPPDTDFKLIRTPPGWFSHFDFNRSMFILFTDYDPIHPLTSKIFRIETPSEPIRTEWVAFDRNGKIVDTGIIVIE